MPMMPLQAFDPGPTPLVDDELDSELYARHAEINSFADLEKQRGTPIPALFNIFYKFIQNPSTVSVETFKRMVDTDDTIGSGVDFLTTCLQARLGPYVHPDAEITEWLTKALDEVKGGFTNMVKELLGASWAGFAVQEKVWGNHPDLGFVVNKLVSLPPSSVLFETERTGDLTEDGILQYQRNYNPSLLGIGPGAFFGFSSAAGRTHRLDPWAKFGDMPFPLRTANIYSYLSIRIPTRKCIHYAFDAQGKFGNPYGRSLLRRAYKWYVMKDGFLQMLSVALDRKGTPLTVVFADPNTTLQTQEAAESGINQKGSSQNRIRADIAASRAFANVHNDSTIILPGKKAQVFDLDFVPQVSNAKDFIDAIQLCDRAMMRALLIPSLIFTNGDGTGSYALGEQHAKTFDKILDGFLDGFKHTLSEQFLWEMMAYNFPRERWDGKDGRGKFSKVQLTSEEIQKEVDIMSSLVNMGAADMNNLEDVNTLRGKAQLEPLTKPIEPILNDEMGNPLPPGSPRPKPHQEPDGDEK